MNTDEILREITGLTRTFMSEKSIKSKETRPQAEERQAGMICELFDILKIDPIEHVDVAVKTVTKLLKARHYSVVAGMMDKIITPRLDVLVEGKRDGKGLAPRVLGLMVCAAYLHHVSGFHLCVNADAMFFAKKTAAQCVAHLQGIAAGIEKLLAFEEELYHFIFNGTVHLFEGALILMRNGLVKEAMLFVGYAAKCCDCTLMSQVRYLSWKVRLHLTLSLGYERLGQHDHSEAVLKRGMDEVKELLELETSDPVPPPPATLDAIRACALQLQAPLFKLAVLRADRGEADAAVDPPAGGKPAKGKGAAAAAAAAGVTPESIQTQLKNILIGIEPAADDPVAGLRALLACVGDGSPITPNGAAAVLAAIDAHLAGMDDPPLELLVEYCACLYAHHAAAADAVKRAAGVPLREKWFGVTADFLDARGARDYEFELNRRLFELSLVSVSERVQRAAAYQAVCDILTAVVAANEAAAGPVGGTTVAGTRTQAASPSRTATGAATTTATTASAQPHVSLIKPKVMTDTAVYLYNMVTNNGDDAVIHGLDMEGFWNVLETVGLVLVHVRHPDVVFTAGVCLLFAKHCEDKAEGSTYGKKQYYQRSIHLLNRLGAFILDRRTAFIRNSQGDVRRVRAGVYSRSLLYKTLETQHGLVEAAALNLQLKLGRVNLKAKMHKSQRDRLVPLRRRQEQSHIFGEPSAKELEIIQHEETKAIEVPSTSEETELRLLREREGNPYRLALACIVMSRFAPNQRAAHQRLDQAHQHILAAVEYERGLVSQMGRDTRRMSSGTLGGATTVVDAGRGASGGRGTPPASPNFDPDRDVLLTMNGVPIDFLWGLLSKAALHSKHYTLVFHAAQLLRERYVVSGAKDAAIPARPAEPLWSNNPMNADIIKKDLVVHVPTPLLEVVAGAFIAAADAKAAAKAVPGLPSEFNDDPETSYDPSRYDAVDVQWERMDDANLLLVALMLAAATKTTSLIVLTCHKVYNCLLPLLRVAAPPPCLLRPLWAVAQTLAKLEGEFLKTTEFQALAVRTMSDVFTILAAHEAPGVVKAAVELFAVLWRRATAHPNDHIIRRVSQLVDYAGIFSGGAAEPEAAAAKPAGKKGGKPPPAGAAQEDTPAALPNAQPTPADTVPMEFLDLLERVIYTFPTACGVLTATHAETPWVPPVFAAVIPHVHTSVATAMDELSAAHKNDVLYGRVAAGLCEQALRQRLPAAKSMAESVITVLKERAKGLMTLQGQLTVSFEEKLANAKKGDEPPAAAPPPAKGKAKPPTPPVEVDPKLKQQREAEAMLKVVGLSLLRRRRMLQLRTLKLRQLGQDTPYRARLLEMLSVLSLQAAETKAAPGELETAEDIAEHWKHEVAAIRDLARASTLYARLGRWKHVYNVMQCTANIINTLFPEIPICVPQPEACRAPDPALQPTPGIILRDEERAKGFTFEDFIPLVRRELVALLGNVVVMSEEVAKGGVDFSEYLDGLAFTAVELTLFPTDDTVASSTSLQLASQFHAKMALKTMQDEARSSSGGRVVDVAFRREEFDARAEVEKEERDERARILADLATAFGGDVDVTGGLSPTSGDEGGTTETSLVALDMVTGVRLQRAGGVAYCDVEDEERATLLRFLHAWHQEMLREEATAVALRRSLMVHPPHPPADGGQAPANTSPRPQATATATAGKSKLKKEATVVDATTAPAAVAGIVTVSRGAYTAVDGAGAAAPHGTTELVHAFPEDIYDHPHRKLLVNVTSVGALTRCWEEKNGALKIGVCAAPRRVVRLLVAAKNATAKYKSVASAVASQGTLDLQDFRPLNTRVEVFDLAANAVKHVGLRDLLEQLENNDYRWFPLTIVVAPAQADGAQSTLFRLSARETSFDAQAALDNRPTSSALAPPLDRTKGKKKVKATDEGGLKGVLARLGEASFESIVDFTMLLLKVLQWSSGTRGLTSLSAVDYGERLNAVSQNTYAAQILPLVMTLQNMAGRSMKVNETILRDVYRDLPRALALIRSGEVGLEAYQASTSWTIAMADANKVRQGISLGGSQGPSTVIRSVATSKSSTNRTGLKNDFYLDVSARFKVAYTFLRAKHLTLMAMKVCLTLGQLHKAHLNHKEASIAWQDGVDIAFGTVHAVQKWRELTAEPPGGPTLVAKLGTSKLLLGIILLYKQASQSLVAKQTLARDHCMLAARLAKAVLSSCVSQPTREYDFSTQLPKEILWAADVFVGPLGVDGKQLMHALAYVAAFCQRIGHNLMSIPVAGLLEYVATNILRNTEYVVLARCLRVRGLAGIGNVEAAADVLWSVLNAEGMPHTWLMQVGVVERGLSGSAGDAPPPSQGGKKPPAKKGGKTTPSINDASGPPSASGPKLSNARPLDRSFKAAIEQLMAPLPQALKHIDVSLQRFFQLTQASFLVCLAEGHPFASLVVPGKPAGTPGTESLNEAREVYATVLQLANTVAGGVEEQCAGVAQEEANNTHRTHRAMGLAIRARAAYVKGDLKAALDVVNTLLDKHAAYEGLSTNVADLHCETLVGCLAGADVAGWLSLKATVLLELRRPAEAMAVCEDGVVLARQQSDLAGELEAKLLKAQCLLSVGLAGESYGLLTNPQTVEQRAAEGGEGRGLPDVGSFARVAAPTRLRNAPDVHAAIVQGGGLLEGMPVTVLQVDHDWSLVKSDEGAQGFMQTRDLRPGVQYHPPPPPVKPRAAMLTEARQLEYDAHDTLLARLIALIITAANAHQLKGKEDTDISILYDDHAPQPASARKPAAAGAVDDPPTPTLFELRTELAHLYRTHVAHLGLVPQLTSPRWEKLFNKHIPAAREAALACVGAGCEMQRRDRLDDAKALFDEGHRITNQTLDVYPQGRSEVLFHLARCRRALAPPPWLWCGFELTQAPSPVAAASVSHQDALDMAAQMPTPLPEIVNDLLAAVELTATRGTYDFELIRNSLMELCFIFGSWGPAVEPTEGTAAAIAGHCMHLACTAYHQMQTVATPQLRDQPILADPELWPCPIGDPGNDLLTLATRTDVEECQRRHNNSQCQFNNRFPMDSGVADPKAKGGGAAAGGDPNAEINGSLAPSTFLMWYAEAIKEVKSQPLFTRSTELRLANWREALQALPVPAGQTPLLWTASTPQLQRLLDVDAAVAGSAPAFHSQLYTVGDVQLPHKPVKAGEPIPTTPTLPPLHWFLTLTPEVEETDAKGALFVRLLLDQREIRAVRQASCGLRSVLSALIEREDELAALAGGAADAAGGGKAPAKGKPPKGDSSNASPQPVEKTPDIVALEDEMEQQSIAFAEAVCAMLQTAFRAVETTAPCPFKEPLPCHYPPVSLAEQRPRNYSVALLLCQVFDLNGGCSSTKLPQHDATGVVVKWLRGVVHSLYPEPTHPAPGDGTDTERLSAVGAA